MILIKRCAALAVLGAGLTACTSGQSAVEPSFTPVNLASTTHLQFAVGTANLASGTATGLNTVVTFRQANGLDATLFNLPTITGPAGFVNNGPAATTGSDAGTNKISSPATLPLVGVAAQQTTFVTGGVASGGAFSYGFAPDNSTQNALATFTEYSEPFFSKQQQFVGGPPFFPFVRTGTFPAGFRGYPPGFTTFDQTTVTAGVYGLSVSIPSSNVATTTLTANGTLASLALLPPIAIPVGLVPPAAPAVNACTHAGADGISVTAVIPAGLTEAAVYVENTTTANFFTFETTTAGAQTFTVPSGLGLQTGVGATPSFTTGNKAVVTIVGFDYPALEGGPPGNTSPTPTIVGANGQADLTMSSQGTCTF